MAKKAAKKGGEPLAVGSKVKAYVASKGLRSSGDLLDAINCCIACCLDDAVERAKANGRATVRASDL